MNSPTNSHQSTLFFPLTGNPAGFHHFLLAELALQQTPAEQVVFLLSNGIHPDPYKASIALEPQERFDILKAAISECHLPSQSQIAQLAEQTQYSLLIRPQHFHISTIEFEVDHAVRLIDHLHWIQQQMEQPDSHLIQLLVGADLIERMANPEIFSDLDLEHLAQHAHFISLDRGAMELESALQAIQSKRQQNLRCTSLDPQLLPEALQPFLQLSSTHIRNALQAQHQLNYFLPQEAAHLLEHLHSKEEDTQEWEQQCWKLEQALLQEAKYLQQHLDQMEQEGKPHQLIVVEASTGGHIAASLTALPGISKHFQEGMTLYSAESKARYLEDQEIPPAVSEAMAQALAQSIQAATGVDYVLVETGMCGPPEGIKRSQKQGQCYFALANAEGVVKTKHYQCSPFFTKREHQLIFARMALEWLITKLTVY